MAWAPSAAFTLTAQITFYMMAPVCAAWLAYRRGDSVRAGVWLGLAAAMKPFLLLFAPYFLLRRDWRALASLLLVVAACVALGLAVFGPRAYVEWFAQLPRISWDAHFMNASLWGALQRNLGAIELSRLPAGDGLWCRCRRGPGAAGRRDDRDGRRPRARRNRDAATRTGRWC